MSNFKVITATIAAAVAQGGTITLSYPADDNGDTMSEGHFSGGKEHFLLAMGSVFSAPTDITIAFGSSIVITYNGATTIPAGSEIRAQLDIAGNPNADPDEVVFKPNTSPMAVLRMDLGTPATADPDGVCESQSDTGAHTLTLDGALVSGGVATFDVPRNVVVDSGGADTAVLTVTGTDVYGATLVENITLNGTTAAAGKKAFKTVTSVTASATISNGAFVGPGVALGLPVFLPSDAHVLGELEDNAAATAGTIAAGLAEETKSTATTADVRGTYIPNSAPNSNKYFSLLVATADPTFLGNPQYAG